MHESIPFRVSQLHFIFYFKKIFIYLWPCWLFIAVRWLSLVVASGAALQSRSTGFSSLWLLLLRSMDSRAQAQSLWHTGFVAPRHVGSSRTRDRTCVLSISRQILNHWTARETPQLHFKWGFLYLFSYCWERSRTLPLLQFVPLFLFVIYTVIIVVVIIVYTLYEF